jgi:hypothetical protein
MAAIVELFGSLNRIITPICRLFEDSEQTIDTTTPPDLSRFYHKVINEVFVLIGTCFLDVNYMKGLKMLWERKICRTLYVNANNTILHPTLPYRNTNLGLALLDSLRELSNEMPNELRYKILSLFDIGIVLAFKKDYRETTFFNAQLYNHFIHPNLYILVCHDFNIFINDIMYHHEEVTIYIHGCKSSSTVNKEVNEDCSMLKDNWIVETNDKTSPFIVCQYGNFKNNIRKKTKEGRCNISTQLTVTHGILHSGSFEVVFSLAEGVLLRKYT